MSFLLSFFLNCSFLKSRSSPQTTKLDLFPRDLNFADSLRYFYIDKIVNYDVTVSTTGAVSALPGSTR